LAGWEGPPEGGEMSVNVKVKEGCRLHAAGYRDWFVDVYDYVYVGKSYRGVKAGGGRGQAGGSPEVGKATFWVTISM